MKSQKLRSVLLALLMILSLSVFASAAEIVESGTLEGSNITWTLDSEGLLTISGEGAMPDYSYLTAPFIGFSTDLSVYEPKYIKKVIIEEGITSIGEYTFYQCGMQSVEIPNSVTSIDRGAFSFCYNLISAEIPNNVTNMERAAFCYCDNLTSVKLGNGITSIAHSAFSNCTGLTSIEIPDNVTSIEESAFDGCTGLTSIVIPDSVTYIGSYAFYECAGLREVYFIGTWSEWYDIVDNIYLDFYTDDMWDNVTVHFVKDDQAAASAVDALIISIGEVEYTEECKDKINTARNAYNYLADDKKVYVENYETLVAAESKYAELEAAADKAAFEEYKAASGVDADAYAQAGDSAALKKLIEDAKTAIDATEYDENKTLEENMTVITDILDKLYKDLDAQRKADNEAAQYGDSEGQGGSTVDKCKYCGGVHEGAFGRIIQFFHNILYFFKNLFK